MEKKFSRGFEFTSNFTWSKLLDIAAQASISNVGSVYNPYNPQSVYGISDHDIPKIWNSTKLLANAGISNSSRPIVNLRLMAGRF